MSIILNSRESEAAQLKALPPKPDEKESTQFRSNTASNKSQQFQSVRDQKIQFSAQPVEF
jgi:hypothetical protein